MFSKFFCKMLALTYNISRCFGGSCFVFNINTEQTTIDQTSFLKIQRNFVLALVWQFLSCLLVLQRLQNRNNLGEFHLTLCWWIGYTVLVILFSFPRYFSAENCDTWNGLTNLLREIHGSLFYIQNSF